MCICASSTSVGQAVFAQRLSLNAEIKSVAAERRRVQAREATVERRHNEFSDKKVQQQQQYAQVVAELKTSNAVNRELTGELPEVRGQCDELTNSLQVTTENLYDMRHKCLLQNDEIGRLQHHVDTLEQDLDVEYPLSSMAKLKTDIMSQADDKEDHQSHPVDCKHRGLRKEGNGTRHTIGYYLYELRCAMYATPAAVAEIQDATFEYAEGECGAFRRARAWEQDKYQAWARKQLRKDAALWVLLCSVIALACAQRVLCVYNDETEKELMSILSVVVTLMEPDGRIKTTALGGGI